MNLKVKICGLTSVQEAAYVRESGADFAGMVLFYEKSRRNLSLEDAVRVREALGPSVKTVAVTVSPDREQVREIVKAGFDYLQIHGSIREGVAETGIPILKAFHVEELEHFDEYRDCSAIAGYVFDAASPGSGRTFDWSLLQKLPRDGKLFFLAGGLNPDNVEEAVRCVHPDGVDVSSGVEYPEGGKNPALIAAFVRNAKLDYLHRIG